MNGVTLVPPTSDIIPRVTSALGRRGPLVAGAVAVVLVSGSVAAFAEVDRGTPAPLAGLVSPGATDEATVARLLAGPGGHPDAAQQASAVRPVPEVAADRAVRLRFASGIDFFVAPSTLGASRVCAFATFRERASSGERVNGAQTGAMCGPVATLSTGLIKVDLQLAPGGLEQPRMRFGLVPDGVAAVRSVDGTAVVANNSYGQRRDRMKVAGNDQRFVGGDGAEVLLGD